jgi:hypothetical protein
VDNGFCCEGFAFLNDNMTTNTDLNLPGDLKKTGVDMPNVKGAAFERLPDEIIEQ